MAWSAEFLSKFTTSSSEWSCSSCFVKNTLDSTHCLSCNTVNSTTKSTTNENAILNTNENAILNTNKEVVVSESNKTVHKKASKRVRIPIEKTSIPTKPKSKKNKSGHVNDITTLVGGTVYACGATDCGQLGMPEKSEELEVPTPQVLSVLEKEVITHVACGGMHALALNDNGKVFSWGCNDDAVLGRNCTDDVEESTPMIVAFDESDDIMVDIAAGDCHSAALTDTGAVLTWGTYKDSSGYIGYTRDIEKSNFPTRVPMPRKNSKKTTGIITKIASGDNHQLALDSNGRVYSWGNGEQVPTLILLKS